MNQPSRSRRQMLITTGSLLVAADWLDPWPAAAQTSVDKDLRVRTEQPTNAEPALEKLCGNWITPTQHFYVRSHAPNPQLDGETFRLRVEGLVRKPVVLSLGQLERYPRRSTIATLTCAGNRRAEFNREGKVGGVQWDAGAIGNARWGGFSLGALLQDAEILEHAKHVWFEGLDQISHGGGTIAFGGSIPIEKALVREGAAASLLATHMNEAPLTRDHGFPLRTIVPGYIGARSVKWLGRIVVSDRPSPNHYLATAYKLVRGTGPLDWSEAGPIYRYPINAAICTPSKNAVVKAGQLDVRGYALPSGRDGSRIRDVLVSADHGDSWTPAHLDKENAPFCWQLWNASVKVNTNTKRLLVKASDTQGGFMPGRVPWNAKGYLQNSWYQLPIRVS